MSFQLASSVRGCSVDLWVKILKECVLGGFFDDANLCFREICAVYLRRLGALFFKRREGMRVGFALIANMAQYCTTLCCGSASIKFLQRCGII